MREGETNVILTPDCAGRKTHDSAFQFGTQVASNLAMRSFLAQLKRARSHQATWAVDDGGFTLVEVNELSRLTQDDRLSLAERIGRIGHALTARELASIFAVSRITVFKHAAAGRIPSFRIGTSVRFDPRLVAEWIRKQ